MGLLSVAYVLWHEYFCMQLIAVYDPYCLQHVIYISPQVIAALSFSYICCNL
jgi:hypothetical protein